MAAAKARDRRPRCLQAAFGVAMVTCAVVAALSGCGESYEQKVTGSVVEAGKPASFLPVRFLSSGAEGSCDLPGAEALTDQMGMFKISQPYRRSAFEDVAVVIHPYRLCIHRSGRWERVWSTTTGPAPR